MFGMTVGKIEFAPQRPGYHDSGAHCRPIDEIASRIAAAKRSKPGAVQVKSLATRDTRANYVTPPFPKIDGNVLTVPAGSMADKVMAAVEDSAGIIIDGKRWRVVEEVKRMDSIEAKFMVEPVSANDNAALPPSEWSPTIGQPEAANSGATPDVNDPSNVPPVGHMDAQGIWHCPRDNYTTLRTILDAAFNHATTGKGKERHARDLPFDKQPMLETTRLVGPGFPLGQAIKKAGEASGMIERGEYGAAEAECLGAINYLAGAVAWMRERKVAA